MSDLVKHPIRFLLSDMDGTLLLPDHSLNQRTIEAVRSLREAGVLFSLATGRPPRAMLQQIEALGVDLPTAAFNGGTLVHPDGSFLPSTTCHPKQRWPHWPCTPISPASKSGYLPMATGWCATPTVRWCRWRRVAWATHQ